MNSDEAEATNNQTEIKKNSKFHMPEVSLILNFKVSPLRILICYSNLFLFLGVDQCYQYLRRR